MFKTFLHYRMHALNVLHESTAKDFLRGKLTRITELKWSSAVRQVVQF